MAVTIMEALQNAHFNLVEQFIPGISDRLGKAQLTNAVELLNKGYGLHDEVEPLLEQYGSLDAVPDKSNSLKNTSIMEDNTQYQLDPNYVGSPSDFEREITILINKHSMESQSETPDFVLAKYLQGCLTNFAVAVLRRDQWYHFNQKKSFNLLDKATQQSENQ